MKKILIAISLMALSMPSFAEWYTVQIKNVYLVADSSYATSDLPGIRIHVIGTFTPTLPCANQVFVIFPTDQLYKETYSMLVAAQLSGTPIQYYHIYCTTPSGIGRGNLYQLGAP